VINNKANKEKEKEKEEEESNKREEFCVD